MGVVFGMYGWYALVVTRGFREQEYVDVVCGGVLNGVCDCFACLDGLGEGFIYLQDGMGIEGGNN